MTKSKPSARTTSRLGRSIFVPSFLFLAALSILWAIASPLLSGPDETAHVTKAVAQVHGQITGHSVPGQKYPVVDLPESYRYSYQIICFAAHSGIPADCGAELGDSAGLPSFGTWVSGYNPVYYYLVGWPSLFLGGSVGVFAMRILSSLISALLLSWAFKAAMASGRTRWMPLGLLFLASPMITYMAAMVNPQGVEISSAALLWVALIRLLQGFDPALKAEEATSEGRLPLSRGLLWTLVAVSAALLANARALGPLWVVIVIALAFTVVGWRATRNLFTTAKSYGPISIVAVASLFSLGWTLFTGSLSGQAAANDAPLVGASFMRGARATLGAMPGFIQQAIGVFGWLDTWLPGWLYWVYLVAMLLLLVPSLLVADRRGKLKLGIVLVAAFLVPVLVQGYSVRQTGMIWQGRYGLFLYVAIPIVAALLLSRSAGPRLNLLTVKVTVVAAGLFAAFSVAAFFFALHRYVVGGGKPIASMMDAARWQPPLGWVALCVLFALVIAGYTAWIIRLAVLARRRDDLLTANA